MTAALKSIAETVEQLPAKDRIYLAERLLASLEDAGLEQDVRHCLVRVFPYSVLYRYNRIRLRPDRRHYAREAAPRLLAA